jgi:hypothetical protein
MPPKAPVIIGINPGSRYVGLAVFRGPVLVDWGIKVMKGHWSSVKLRRAKRLITLTINCFQPDALAIKRLHPARSSRGLDRLVLEVTNISRQRGLNLHQYSIGDLEAFFCSTRKASKSDLAESLAARYPELHSELQREGQTRNPYHIRMFEAVALGAICAHNFNNL